MMNWTSVEVNLAIICACLMMLKPLVAKFFPKLFESIYAVEQCPSFWDTSGNMETPVGNKSDKISFRVMSDGEANSA